MQRGSDRLSVHRDDEMKHELQGMLKSGHPTRSEEWHDPEPSAEDDPEVAHGPVTPSRAPSPLEAVRLELARNLTRGTFPADAHAVARALRRGNAPDALVGQVEQLSDKEHQERYANVHQLAEALTTGGRGGAGDA